MSDNEPELSDYDSTEPELLRQMKWNNRVKKMALYVVLTGLGFCAGFSFEEYVVRNAGPKNGITTIEVNGCGAADILKPTNHGNTKVTATQFEALGFVTIELTTKIVSEGQIRNPGLLEDPKVPVNTLVVTCDELPDTSQQVLLTSLVEQSS